jgi:hypothetical protein
VTTASGREAPGFRVVTYNAWIGQDETDDDGRGDLLDNVIRLIEAAGDPHVLSLQEVWDWSERVPGYRRVQAPRDRFPHREARSTQLLVRRDLPLIGHGAREAHGPWWTGPKHGIPHPPRVFPRASVGYEDVVVDVFGLHFTRPAWSEGGAAWKGEQEVLVDWAHDRPPNRPQVFLGDLQGNNLGHLAHRLDAQVWARGIDGALVHGMTVAGIRRIPGRFGGDGHRPVLLRLVPRP